MTRLKTSRPNRSVPKSAFPPGADSTRSKFCSSGGWGARGSAKTAVTTIRRAKSPPTTTTVLRATRRSCRAHRPPPRSPDAGIDERADRVDGGLRLGQHRQEPVPHVDHPRRDLEGRVDARGPRALPEPRRVVEQHLVAAGADPERRAAPPGRVEVRRRG